MREALSGVAVIFDLDGTLIDTAADLAAAMNHVLASSGRDPLPLEKVRHLVGHGARAMLAAAFEENTPPSDIAMDEYVNRFLDYYLANIAVHSAPFPGAVEAMRILSDSGAKIAICTNKREAPARMLIETLGLSDVFTAIVGGDTACAAKPDPAPVRLCLEHTGASRGVFVGDSDTDLRAAVAVSIPCIIARFGYGPTMLMHEAFASFEDYADLPDLVFAAANQGQA